VGGPGEASQGDQEMQRPVERDVPSKAGVVLYVEDNLSNVKLIENLLTHRPAVRLITAMQGSWGSTWLAGTFLI